MSFLISQGMGKWLHELQVKMRMISATQLLQKVPMLVLYHRFQESGSVLQHLAYAKGLFAPRPSQEKSYIYFSFHFHMSETCI